MAEEEGWMTRLEGVDGTRTIGEREKENEREGEREERDAEGKRNRQRERGNETV